MDATTNDPDNYKRAKINLKKRRHSETEETLTGESDTASPPHNFGEPSERESQSDGSPSSNNRTSSESPFDLSQCTSLWTDSKELNRLNVETVLESTADDVFEMGFRNFLKGDKQNVNNYMKKHFPIGESDDLFLKAEKECFEYAVKHIIAIDCEHIDDVDATEIFRFSKELGKKSFSEFTTEPKYSNWLCSRLGNQKDPDKNMEKKDETFKIRKATCQKIFERLKMFSDQILTMVNNKRKKVNLTEQMFQDLFIAFVRIFDLMIIDNKNMQPYEMTVGKEKVSSEPDAIICKFFPTDVLSFTEKVIAVVEVKREYSRGTSVTTERSGDRTTSIIGHVNSNLKGQHTGEMIAALPSSVFGSNGVYGLIVQGTKVTVVSLRASGQFLEQLQKGKVKNAHAIVRYSPEYNVLTKHGRCQLMKIFMGMKVLLQQLEM